MDKDDIRKKIQEDEAYEDFIRCPKCGNSIKKLLAKYPDGVEDSAIARFLMLTEEEIERIHKEAAKMLREDMEE